MKEGPFLSKILSATTTADTGRRPVGLAHRDVSPHLHPEGRIMICTEPPRLDLCLSLAQCLVSEASVCEQKEEAKAPTVYSL